MVNGYITKITTLQQGMLLFTQHRSYKVKDTGDIMIIINPLMFFISDKLISNETLWSAMVLSKMNLITKQVNLGLKKNFKRLRKCF